MRNRRAALEGLARILDAGAPEELFAGTDDDASFLYELLAETARARSSTYYWEICRTARRRGVTPEYVIDRAVVLLAAIRERQRMDLYRILGVPPLASGEVVRHRFLDLAKRHHPDAGGDAARFRQAKQAYEVLRDPDRRAEYERFWVRALGPFERAAASAGPELEAPAAAAHDGNGARPEVTIETPPAPAGALAAALADAARVFAARAGLDRRIGAVADEGGGGLGGLLARIEGALAPISAEELDRLSVDVAQVTARLETMQAQLAALAALRRTLPTSA